ncbi:hypothetical protein ACTA71_002241 [Dictyostelium dimigraforme]
MKLILSILFLIFTIDSVFSNLLNETIVLTPYMDSGCTQVGGGIGYGYMFNIPNSNSIPIFSNPYEVLNFVEEPNESTLLMNVFLNDNLIYSEDLKLRECQYVDYLQGYYFIEFDTPLPSSSIQFNMWTADGSVGESCSVDIYENFNFVTNGTIVSLSYDNAQETQQFTCVNSIPFITVCKNPKSCQTNQITTCFDGQFRASCTK